MLSYRTSCISASLNAFSPDFDAQYAAAADERVLAGQAADVDDESAAALAQMRNRGVTALKTPVRLVSMTSDHCAGVMSATLAKMPTPALLTRMSRPPKRATVAATTRSMSASAGHRPGASRPRRDRRSRDAGERRQTGLVAPGDGDVDALRHERARDRQSDTTRPAGDDGGLLAQGDHQRSALDVQRSALSFRPQCADCVSGCYQPEHPRSRLRASPYPLQ